MPVRRVALLIETSRQFGREMLRGVIRYQLDHEPWEIAFESVGFNELTPRTLQRWRGDGILARVNSLELARALGRKGIPLVDLRGLYPKLKVPRLTIDNREIVRLALDHLRQTGLTQFAYVGVPPGQDPWLDDRCSEFRRQLNQLGLKYHVFESHAGIVGASLADERASVAKWLKTLPTPIGILAYNDYRGQQVLDSCRRIGWHVPDEAAVIGIDNDEFLCNLSNPTLTSVDLNLSEAGYEAARTLDRLMAGKRPDRERIVLRAKSVIVRQSTNCLHIDDESVRTVVRIIRQRACEKLTVSALLQEVRISRRTLEQRFSQVVGRTLNDEIIRVRMVRARQILMQTQISVEDVAAKIGIATASHFSHLFKKETGLTPREYRNQFLVSK